MTFTAIFIEPHERYEAIEAYRSRLTEKQMQDIEDAPETALIRIEIDRLGYANIVIIEEG